MREVFVSLIVWSYGLTGVVGLIGYMVTLRDLHSKKQMSANVVSYAIWTLTGAVTFLYGMFIVPDRLFQLISGFNFAACLMILVLAVRVKSRMPAAFRTEEKSAVEYVIR